VDIHDIINTQIDIKINFLAEKSRYLIIAFIHYLKTSQITKA